MGFSETKTERRVTPKNKKIPKYRSFCSLKSYFKLFQIKGKAQNPMVLKTSIFPKFTGSELILSVTINVTSNDPHANIEDRRVSLIEEIIC